DHWSPDTKMPPYRWRLSCPPKRLLSLTYQFTLDSLALQELPASIRQREFLSECLISFSPGNSPQCGSLLCIIFGQVFVYHAPGLVQESRATRCQQLLSLFQLGPACHFIGEPLGDRLMPE